MSDALLDLCIRLRAETGRSTTAEDVERLTKKISLLLPAEANAERSAMKMFLRAAENWRKKP